MLPSTASLENTASHAPSPDPALHLYIVERVARRIARRVPNVVDFRDLLGAGSVGLLDALSKYNPERACFEAYAEIRIRGAILDHLRDTDWLPRAQRARARAGEQLGVIGVDDVEEDGFESFAGDELLPTSHLAKKQSLRSLRTALDDLSERHKQVLSLYYVDDLTLKEIGSILGVTESRVCQIHGAAIVELRKRIGDDADHSLSV